MGWASSCVTSPRTPRNMLICMSLVLIICRELGCLSILKMMLSISRRNKVNKIFLLKISQVAEVLIGWDYYVQPPTVKRIPPKNYGENYAYKPHKLRIARTK